MKGPGEILFSPNGNGGFYKCLTTTLYTLVYNNNMYKLKSNSYNVLDFLINNNIQYVHLYGVDNILVRVADPIGFGLLIKEKLDILNKTIDKINPNENVGIYALYNNHPSFIEYSEITSEQANLRDSDNHLIFSQANIVSHFITTTFLKYIIENMLYKKLPIHIAKKNVSTYINDNNTIKTTTINAVKMEYFLFDILIFSKPDAVTTLTVYKSHEFSPIKNRVKYDDNGNPIDTVDSSITAINDLYNYHRKLLSDVGCILHGDGFVEISPLVSYSGEGLDCFNGRNLCLPMHVTDTGQIK